MDELESQQEVELEEELDDGAQEASIPTYPVGIEQLRQIFAKNVDPRDQVRVYLRLAAIAIGLYYLGSGIFGIVTGG